MLHKPSRNKNLARLESSLKLLAILVIVAACQSRTFTQVRMPQIQFSDRLLANGLRIISAPDHSSPTVAIQVWYHVGSKDDPEKRSGFAHLFEHMMFKSCLLYTSDAADERSSVDLGGRRIIKKKK